MPPSDAFINQQLAAAQQMARAGQLDRAMAQLGAIVRVAPWRIEPYLGSGSISLAAGQFEEALSWFERARKMAPALPPVLEGAGQALLALGRSTEALANFQKLQASGSPIAFYGAGEALKQLGRIAEARTALERAVALAPEVAGYHYALAQIARFVPDDPRLPGLERLVRKASGLPEPERCELYFALAKAYDELGRHAAAFEHWQKANALKHRAVQYDEAMYLGILRDLEAAFTPALMASRQGCGDPSALPAFVVGMPRSGTTLVEQIIASHPQVFGAGEKMYLHHLLGQNLAGPEFPAHLPEVSAAALRMMGARYVAQLKADAPGATRIVDKLTANFMLCGLIHLILPNAKIIHVQRDPLDTCFSCFTNLFSQSIDYSYDLGELGRYYRSYERLMAHWRHLLPQGAMLDVSYEALVGDFETEARRIVAYTGLAWDDACLSFHTTKRVVHTLSAAQVRQPLYQTAIGRTVPYTAWLEPLRRALAGD
ncbi:MAG: sulfotransferase [Rhizomicrobium sp.]|nr:sulfotransferase [Rhizomicrobium sp.]